MTALTIIGPKIANWSGTPLGRDRTVGVSLLIRWLGKLLWQLFWAVGLGCLSSSYFPLPVNPLRKIPGLSSFSEKRWSKAEINRSTNFFLFFVSKHTLSRIKNKSAWEHHQWELQIWEWDFRGQLKNIPPHCGRGRREAERVYRC